jgi:hypothetical protein
MVLENKVKADGIDVSLFTRLRVEINQELLRGEFGWLIL